MKNNKFTNDATSLHPYLIISLNSSKHITFNILTESRRREQKADDFAERVKAAWTRGAITGVVAQLNSPPSYIPPGSYNPRLRKGRGEKVKFDTPVRRTKIPDGLPATPHELFLHELPPAEFWPRKCDGCGKVLNIGVAKPLANGRWRCRNCCGMVLHPSVPKFREKAQIRSTNKILAGPRYEDIPEGSTKRVVENQIKVLKKRQPIPPLFRFNHGYY
jgi:hypothetical protein